MDKDVWARAVADRALTLDEAGAPASGYRRALANNTRTIGKQAKAAWT
jgi:hypothetical protein